MKKIKLFCLAHAGGSVMSYSQFKKSVNSSIEIILLELSGRGSRMDENFYNSFEEAISDLFSQVNAELDDNEFAFFGHSMGATLAYELVYKIKKLRDKQPVAVFFSGTLPPDIIHNEKKIHLLPDKEFIEEVVSYGGMSEEILQQKDLMKFITPILRADFRVLGTYEYVKKDSKLNCDIVALTGKDDKEVNTEDFLRWKEHTNAKCDIYMFDGGHFYINDNINSIVDIINEKLLESQK